jgi:hypothetical protein
MNFFFGWDCEFFIDSARNEEYKRWTTVIERSSKILFSCGVYAHFGMCSRMVCPLVEQSSTAWPWRRMQYVRPKRQ